MDAKEARALAERSNADKDKMVGEHQYTTLLKGIEKMAKEGFFNYTIEMRICNSHAKEKLEALNYKIKEGPQSWDDDYTYTITW